MARILAVDDEPLVRHAVSRLMHRLGHEVVEAGDGNTAIALVQAEAFDVALVDYDMPGGPDGLAVLAHLRELAPGCARVLMTGRTDFPVIVRAVNQGEILRVLPKPFHGDQLEELLREGVEASRRLAALARSADDETGASRLYDELTVGEHLSLAVQPIVDAAVPDRIVAAECLLRSTHAVLSDPSSVLAAVERSNRVRDLGGQVNRLAADWVARLPEDILVFVNVHPAQLDETDVLERFAPLLPHARRVVLEITERANLRDVPCWERALDRLGDHGFRFAVDDVGSGYGALALLADVRPAFIKVDHSIVRGVDANPHKQRLIDLLVRFADATGAKLVAEGVETAAEATSVVRSGAHLLQGFLFGRPSRGWPTP